MKFVPGELLARVKKGLGNECIDKWAKRMLSEMDQFGLSTWIPAIQCSLLVLHTDDVMLHHWLVAALHGTLRGCAVLQGHWVYVEMKVTGNMLQVSCWDGLGHQARQLICRFAEAARRILSSEPWQSHSMLSFSQRGLHTCGTVALMHLGHSIGIGMIVDYLMKKNGTPPCKFTMQAAYMDWDAIKERKPWCWSSMISCINMECRLRRQKSELVLLSRRLVKDPLKRHFEAAMHGHL